MIKMRDNMPVQLNGQKATLVKCKNSYGSFWAIRTHDGKYDIEVSNRTARKVVKEKKGRFAV